jgi:hypothetical protein
MLTIDDISHWVKLGGIGHVVLTQDGGWVTTPCGHWMTGDVTAERPKRVCRKCRKAIPTLRRTGATS